MFLASIPALYSALSGLDLDRDTVRVLLPDVPAPVGSALKKFMVTFPDGGTMSFDGFVTHVQSRAAIDSITTVEMEVVPTGEVVSTPATSTHRPVYRDEVTVTHNGETIGDVLSIETPQLKRSVYEVTTADHTERTYIEGIKRAGPMRLELAWDKDFDVKKLMS